MFNCKLIFVIDDKQMKSRRKFKMPNGSTIGVFLLLGIGLCFLKINIAQAALANHVVINEVQIDSTSGSGGTNDDWVELYNPTSQDVALDGWSIQKTTATGGSLVKQALSGTIPANGFFLIVRNNASTTPALKNQADMLASDSFSLADNNVIYLVNVDNKITTSTDPSIVDFVGFGNTNIHEGAAAAPAIPGGKSIGRVPDGEDTDQNSVDFILQDTPTPQNSGKTNGSGDNSGVNGTVALTITPDQNPAQNIGVNGAQIVFQVNTVGQALVNYGLSNTYGSSTAAITVSANTNALINLSGLQCGTTYHYSIHAANVGATDSDQTPDATFATLPCTGIVLNSLAITKSTAKADDDYSDGWQWQFNITVWNMGETSLKMKFDGWSGAGTLDAANNMQFSVDNGADWFSIASNGAYAATGANIGSIDNSTDTGRQVKILVRMKVPTGTLAGIYNSSYGILTE
jgi:hypothetical protein